MALEDIQDIPNPGQDQNWLTDWRNWKKIKTFGLTAIKGTIAVNQVAYGTATGTIGGSANLTFDGNTLASGNAAIGAILTLAGKTGFTNPYSLDLSSTSGTLDVRVNSGSDRFVSLTNTGAGVLSLLVDGRINVNGAADTANYGVNVKSGYVATSASFGHRAYGVGNPGDANTEYLELYHDGSGNLASIDSNKTGSGTTVRSLVLRTGGTAAITISGTNGDITASNNFSFFGTASLGGGSKVIFIANAATDPTSNPTGGGILYCSGGALKYRGSAGTVTTLAAA